MATQVSRPVQLFQCATVRASIWRNQGKRGAFHAITLSHTFIDAEGHPKSSGPFGKNDLSAAATVVAQAELMVSDQWIATDRRAEFPARRQQGEPFKLEPELLEEFTTRLAALITLTEDGLPDQLHQRVLAKGVWRVLKSTNHLRKLNGFPASAQWQWWLTRSLSSKTS